VDYAFRLGKRTCDVRGEGVGAKEAAVEDGPEVYDKRLREEFITREKEYGLNMW
jgi:hypothetical protein